MKLQQLKVSLLLLTFLFVIFIDGFDLNFNLKTRGLKSRSPSLSMQKNDVINVEGRIEEDIKLFAKTVALIPVTLFCGAAIAMADSSDAMVVSIVRPSLDLFVNVLSFLFIVRTVLSWYPKTDLQKFPYNAVIWPTEPLLEPVRGLIPPAFGVDVSSIVWIMLLSFVREILTGQQGILTLIERS